MPKIKYGPEKVAEAQLTEIFFKLINDAPANGITADEVVALARERDINPVYLKKVPAMFRKFSACGYLRRSDLSRTSTRNDSSLLRVWFSTKTKKTN